MYCLFPFRKRKKGETFAQHPPPPFLILVCRRSACRFLLTFPIPPNPPDARVAEWRRTTRTRRRPGRSTANARPRPKARLAYLGRQHTNQTQRNSPNRLPLLRINRLSPSPPSPPATAADPHVARALVELPAHHSTSSACRRSGCRWRQSRRRSDHARFERGWGRRRHGGGNTGTYLPRAAGVRAGDRGGWGIVPAGRTSVEWGLGLGLGLSLSVLSIPGG